MSMRSSFIYGYSNEELKRHTEKYNVLLSDILMM